MMNALTDRTDGMSNHSLHKIPTHTQLHVMNCT